MTNNPDTDSYYMKVGYGYGLTLSKAFGKDKHFAVTAGLLFNTTYFARVTAAYGLVQVTTNTVPASTSTLTDLVSGSRISQTLVSSITANWTALTGGSGAGTAEGYLLQASTDSIGFYPVAGSSATTLVSLSTLTVGGLSSGTTYYLRVGALNWNNRPNFVTIGSTTTDHRPPAR